ncbi:MAG: hypothetical protein HYT35_00795 [Candidatus Staskawiczbacteria bacterium]|nr:hypothetical protein [Candidatus Staskawiczbacteria bacterium]
MSRVVLHKASGLNSHQKGFLLSRAGDKVINKDLIDSLCHSFKREFRKKIHRMVVERFLRKQRRNGDGYCRHDVVETKVGLPIYRVRRNLV